jgi:hypothetical protein
MKPVGSLQCPQEPASEHCPESTESRIRFISAICEHQDHTREQILYEAIRKAVSQNERGNPGVRVSAFVMNVEKHTMQIFKEINL